MDLASYITKSFNLLIKRQKGFEREAKSNLVSALKDIRGEVSVFYKKYAKNGKLSITELEKNNRYKAMETKIFSAVDEAIKDNISVIKHSLGLQYKEGFYRTAWAFDNQTKLRLDWRFPSSDSINKMFSLNNLNNMYYIEAMNNYPIDVKRKVRQAIMNNLTIGKSRRAMEDDIKKALNWGAYKSNLIIQTEGTAAINAGINAVFLDAERMGIKGKFIWNAVNDLRTRPDHRDMHGKVKKDDGYYDGPGGERAPYPGWVGLSAEQRCNCRCLEVYAIDNTPQSFETRKQEAKLRYTAYSTWLKERGYSGG